MPFETNVFINCPLDKDYIDDLLKPMLLIIVKNGLTPRLSIEVSDSGEVRLQKITNIIRNCKFSIHDLSLVRAKKAGDFARMNMPFELGIDYGLRTSGIDQLAKKQFLILEAKRYDYQKAISDINGFDVKVHANNSQIIFSCLYSWFSETVGIQKQNPPLKTYGEFVDFSTCLFEEKLAQFGSDDIAIDYIENLSIPEYVQEITDRR